MKIRQNSEKIGRLDAELKIANRKLDEFEGVVRNTKIANEKAEYVKNIRDYGVSLNDYVRSIKTKIVETVREQLEEKTKSYFFDLIWKKDAFSDVRILNQGLVYKFSVLDDMNRECLGALSAGEKQVLALAFTAALYKVSGYSVPVFIDTPLGRISEAPRENIAEHLPKYLSEAQLIMLPTDTEYTPTIRDILSTCVGKEYKIFHDTVKKTSEVVEYD